MYTLLKTHIDMAQVSAIGLIPVCTTPITDGTLVGSGTEHPLGLTKEELCYLYWKTKSLSYNFSETLTVEDVSYYNTEQGYLGDPSLMAGTDTKTGTASRVNNPASEINLLCSLSSYDFSAGRMRVEIGFQTVYEFNNLYYPRITVGSGSYSSVNPGNINAVISQINTYIRVYFPSYSFSYGGDGGTCSLDIFGTGAKNLPLYLYNVSLDFSGSEEVSAQIWDQGFLDGFYFQITDPYTSYYAFGFKAKGEASISISVNELWPYNP
jgi:hypothetical protein